jgi:spore coat protein U-like protein
MRSLGAIRLVVGVCAVGTAAVIINSTVVSAQAPTADMAVAAAVSRNCTVSAASITFPNYDPVVANATAPLTGTGNVRVACTKGVAPAIGLSLGSFPNGSSRQMASGDERLVYELFKDTNNTTWGETGNAQLTATPALSRTARDFTVYGRIAGGQDVAAGSYSDTVVATVNF